VNFSIQMLLEDAIFAFSSMHKLMICYRYAGALFYNTAHLLHDEIVIPGGPLVIYPLFNKRTGKPLTTSETGASQRNHFRPLRD